MHERPGLQIPQIEPGVFAAKRPLGRASSVATPVLTTEACRDFAFTTGRRARSGRRMETQKRIMSGSRTIGPSVRRPERDLARP